jgi:bis(5'-nucleosyl)-tetraphosphatase (symmetrical)
MEFSTKEGAAAAPLGYMPWFDVPGRRTAAVTVAFGHWSTLGSLDRPELISLDTGCVWGGCLSAMRLAGVGDSDLVNAGVTRTQQLIQVKCEPAQNPGKN